MYLSVNHFNFYNLEKQKNKLRFPIFNLQENENWNLNIKFQFSILKKDQKLIFDINIQFSIFNIRCQFSYFNFSVRTRSIISNSWFLLLSSQRKPGTTKTGRQWKPITMNIKKNVGVLFWGVKESFIYAFPPMNFLLK